MSVWLLRCFTSTLDVWSERLGSLAFVIAGSLFYSTSITIQDSHYYSKVPFLEDGREKEKQKRGPEAKRG